MEAENIVAYGRLPSPAHHTMTSILNLFIGIIRDKETRTKLTLLISEQLERRSIFWIDFYEIFSVPCVSVIIEYLIYIKTNICQRMQL